MSSKATCAVSRAPISSGHPVRLFFIASNRGKIRSSADRSTISKGSISCHYDDFKIIGSVGLKAFYADFGTYIFDEKTIEAEHILEEIKHFYVKNPIDIENEGVDRRSININKEDLNFKKIQFMINEGDLYISSFNHNILNFVSVMAVHEDIYQMMINEETRSYDISCGDYRTIRLKEVIDENMIKYYTWKDFIEKEKMKYLDLISKNNQDLTEQEINESHSKARYITRTIFRFGEDYERFYVLNSRDSLISFLDTYEKYENETEENVVSKIIEARLFSEKLNQHNIMIRPTMTSCETKDIEDTMDFYKKVSEVLDEINDNEFVSFEYEDDEEENED